MPNKTFIIGTQAGCDVRLHKHNKHIRYVFQLNQDGLITTTNEAATIPSVKTFANNREHFQIDGKTFLIEYVKPSELTSAIDIVPAKSKLRKSCIPTLSGTDNKFDSALKPTETSIVMKTPRRISTNSDSDGAASAPGTPVPVRTTPSVRRSNMYRQSMAPLAEEDESNSNDSKYKTPENTTPVPKIVMRSHKSAVKSNFDREGTPKCVTPSEIKARLSLVMRASSDMHRSPESSNTSDEDSDENDGVTINTTSGSESDAAKDISGKETCNEEECSIDCGEMIIEEADEAKHEGQRKVIKRGRAEIDSEDDSDDPNSEKVVEPQKKRMKRETYPFRDRLTRTIGKAFNSDHSSASKKSMENVSYPASESSFVNTSDRKIKRSRLIMTANTFPRLNSVRQEAPHQMISRRSLSVNRFAGEALSHQQNCEFNEYAINSPSPQPRSEEFTFDSNSTNSNTTSSSSFQYILGKDVEPSGLGLSVFSNILNDTSNNHGDDLMEFSSIATPEKSQKMERKSGRALKPSQLFSPNQSSIAIRSPPKRNITPKMSKAISLVDLSNLRSSETRNNTTSSRKGSRTFIDTPRPLFIKGLDGHKNVTFDAESLLNNSNKHVKRNGNSCTPGKMLTRSLSTISLLRHSANRTPLSPRSVQKNHVNSSLISFDSPIENKKTSIKTLPQMPKTKLTFDSDESFSELRKSIQCQFAGNTSVDNSGVKKKVLNKTKRTSRNLNQTKNTDMSSDESVDSFIENRSTPYQRPIKKITTKSNESLIKLKAPIISESLKDFSIVLNKANLLDQPVLRRSSRTPKKNSALDESIFDTSTSTKQSQSRSLSLGRSLSLNEDSFKIANGLSSSVPKKQSMGKRTKSTSVLFSLGNVKSKQNISPGSDLINIEGLRLKSILKMQKQPKNDLTDLRGVKNLLKTPRVKSGPKNDLTNVQGVRQLLRTPKTQKQAKNDLSDLRGVGKLMKTPKLNKESKNDLSDLRGVRKLLKTPKQSQEPKNDLRDLRGIRNLLKTPKPKKEPKNDLGDLRGVGKLLKTPKPRKEPLNDLTDIRGVKKLLGTPKQVNSPKNDLTMVAGVKRLLGTPKMVKEPKNDLSDVFGLKKLMKSPRTQKIHTADFTDISGVAGLFNLQDDESDSVSVTSTTLSDMSARKARARRGKIETIDTNDEPIVVPKRKLAVKVVELLPVEKTVQRGRPKRAVVKKVELPEPLVEPPKKRRKQNKKQLATIYLDEEIDVPVKVKKQATKSRATKEKHAEIEMHQVEEITSTIRIKTKAPSRKRANTTKNVIEEHVEDVEPVAKKGRPRKKVAVQDEAEMEAPSVTKGRSKRNKAVKQMEEVELPQIIVKKARVQRAKAKPVEEVFEDDDTIFTSVEEIVDKAPVKAVRVTRARRGRGARDRTEESYDIESVDQFTTVEVKKPVKTKATTKRVQFDDNVKNSPVRTQKPKSRRLLSEDEIDEMSDNIMPVASTTRKSARSKK